MSKLLYTMRGHTDCVGGVAFFNDGHRVVTGSRDKTLRIWNVPKGTLLGKPLQEHSGTVLSVAVSPDDKRIASGGQDTYVIIWDVRKHIVFKRLFKHRGDVNCVCFSPDGKRLASGSQDGTVIIWDSKSGAVLTTIVVDGFWVSSVAFSPDGLKLASGTSEGSIRVFRTNNAELLLNFWQAHKKWVCDIVWSPDGQKFISASHDETVKFWDSSTGRQIVCTGHTSLIHSLAIASDGSFIAAASSDHTVRLWSTKTYQQIGQPLKHTQPVICVAISTNGALLASGTLNKNLYLWSIGNMLQRQDGQKRYKEELRVEQQRRLSEIEVLPTPPAESNTHKRTNSSAGPPSFEMSATLPETKENRVRGIIKRLYQQLRDLHVKSPSTGPEERMVHSNAQSSIILGRATHISSAPPMSFVQSRSSVPPKAILQDLTESITKVGNFPVVRGGFGEVWKCIYQTDLGPTDVAVKSLLVYASDQNGEGMEKKTKRIRRELKTCARLHHENILPLFGYTHGFGPLVAMVYPWAEKGNLTSFLDREGSRLSVVRRFKILKDITAGLQYLHKNNVIHGDLTGPNVLIKGDGIACLADFGLSLVYSEVTTPSKASWTSSFHGNFRWLAPELLGEPEDDLPVRPSKSSDIYSFGGVMLQVLSNNIPYYYLTEAALIQRIGSRVKPLRARYPAVSDKYWRFIRMCWSDEMDARPMVEEVVEWIVDESDSLDA